MNHHWLLPEACEDLLPAEAARVEALRRRLLDEFARHGYELIMAPLLEYADSLRSSGGNDIDTRSFKLIDQASGRTLALRADTTPQAARIDAHMLGGRAGINRLCYCGSVLHTLPAGLFASREPIQIGAELFGHAGIEADIEIVRLTARTLALCELSTPVIDLGHSALFRALCAHAGLNSVSEHAVCAALQSKDQSGLRELLTGVSDKACDAFLTLTECHGAATILDDCAQRLPKLPEIQSALDDLRRLADELTDLNLSFDLADLRGYEYHTGIVFAAYVSDSPAAVASGGRYDGIGARYGRRRPATGFSLDLRTVARLGRASSSV